jgi:protein-L-isoaspartate(D-aspartate) O-methyltransferase
VSSADDPDLDEQEAGLGPALLQLRAMGLRDPALTAAIERVDRETFVPAGLERYTWRDMRLPLPCGQEMAPLLVIVRLLQAAKLSAGQRVLEVGTGSGYQAALLATLGCHVVTIERYRTLAEGAAKRLSGIRGDLDLHHADGLDPTSTEGLFDRIIVTAAIEPAPPDLIARLTPEGLLVAPLIVPGHGVRLAAQTLRDGAVTVRDLARIDIGPAMRGISRTI